MKKSLLFLIAVFFAATSTWAQAQPAPTTTIVPVTTTVCGAYDFEVTVKDFINVGAISLVLNYDPLVLSFQSVDLNGAISGYLPNGAILGKFILGGYADPVTLNDNSVLFTLHFNLLPVAGTSNLSWSTVQGDCEYAGPGGSPTYTATFNDLTTWTIPARPVKNLTTSLEYCTIQAAIDDDPTVDGDIIQLVNGGYTNPYTEGPILVHKAVKINGFYADTPGYDGLFATIFGGHRPGTSETFIINSPITITAAGAEINGFRIAATDLSYTYFIDIHAEATVKNCIIYRSSTTLGNTVKGIIITGGSGFTIEGNAFDGNSNNNTEELLHKTLHTAIDIQSGYTGIGSIKDNRFQNILTAINADAFSSGIAITGNFFTRSGTVISFGAGATTAIDGQYNTISGNYFDIDVSTLNKWSKAIYKNINVAATFRMDAISNTFVKFNNSGTTFITPLALADKYFIENKMFHRGRDLNGTPTKGVIDYILNEQFVVPNGPGTVNGIPPYAHNTPIQSAINAGRDGDKILIYGGEYTDNAIKPPLPTKNLNFEGSVNGSGIPATIIKGYLNLTGNNGGKSIKNIKFLSNSTTANVHLLTLKSINDLSISNCIFDGNGIAQTKNGIHLNAPNTNLTVDNCKFINGLYVAISSYTTDLTVTNSTFTNVKSGINHQGGNNLIVQDCDINIVAQTGGSDSYGVRFASATGTSNGLDISGSTFSVVKNETESKAIWVRAAASGTLKVTGSRILGDVLNLSTTSLDAECNWWGTADVNNIPPFITGIVDFSPWLVLNNASGATFRWSGTTKYSCSGEPVIITDAVPTDAICGTLGSIMVTFTGGTAPYTISPVGEGSGTTSDLNYNITGLTAGNYTINVSDVNGTSATFSPAVEIKYLPVTNTTGPAYFATIQAAIDAATAGDVIEVCAGTYAEIISIDKPLTLRGPNYTLTGFDGTRDPLTEAIITFPDGLTWAAWEGLVTVNADVNNVTIEGFDIKDKDYLIAQMPILILTHKANNLTIRNNRMYGGEMPLYVLTGTSVNDYRDGLLVEGNYMNSGPFVNSGYNRGMYIQATAGTIKNNQIENTSVGIQILHYGNPTGGVVENNIISADHIGLYHNGHALGGGDWTWSGNTVTVAPNDRTGLNAQVKSPRTGDMTFSGIHIINLGHTGTGNPPNVFFNNNSIDGTHSSSPFTNVTEGVRLNGSYGSGTATITENSFTNIGKGVNNETACKIQANCNWWGSAAYEAVFAKMTGPVVFINYLTDGTDASTDPGFQPITGACNGLKAEPANLTLTYTEASKNILFAFDVTVNKMELQPIPDLDPTIPAELAAIGALYQNLADAIAGNDPATIQAAALPIGDDIMTEYYYFDNANNKVYITTNGGDPLIKNKYWDGYLVSSDNVNLPTAALTLINEDNYRTATNPGTVVPANWLEPVLGRDLYVKVTFIQNGNVTSEEATVLITRGPVNVYSADPTTPENWVSSHTTIQEGISAETTLPDFVIVFDAGTYNESDITINKDGLTLIGAGETQTFINPDPTKLDDHDCSPLGGTPHHGIIVQAQNVTIKDLTVDGGTAKNYRMGITSDYWSTPTYDYTTIQDVTVTNINYRGIVLRKDGSLTTGHKVLSTTVTNGGCDDEQSYAILGFNVDNTEIKNCVVSNFKTGIATGNYTGIQTICNIENNSVTDAVSQAYYLTHNGAGSTFSGNTATFTNAANVGTGLATYQCEITLTNNTFTGAKVGIAVEHQPLTKDKLVISSGNTITGLLPIINGSVGILANDETYPGVANNFTVTETTITGYESGILIDPLHGMSCDADINNNTISASAVGINVNDLTTSATSGLTIKDNAITLTSQLSGANPTIGISLSKVTGTAAAEISGNTVANSFYGYLVYNLNTLPVTTITGGTITGVMVGVSAVNLDQSGVRAPSDLGVSSIAITDFTGAHAGAFHAGVYVYTGGAEANTSITATVDKVSVTGTGKIAQDCAGLSFADFSTLASAGQNITVTECTLTGNLNRGINVRGANALVDLGTSTLTGNGSDPYVTGGNNGFGIMAHTNANVNVHNCFITNPASTINPVYALFANGATITAIDNYLDNNGNTTMGKIAVSQGVGSFTATCNWWGSADGGVIAPMISGDVDYVTWLVNGTDNELTTPGFQPVPNSCTGAPDLTGTYNYYNTAETALNDVTVELWKDDAKVYDPVTTDASGNYTFTNVLPETYEVRATTTKSKGGINSTDAAQVNYWTAFNSTIEKVRWLAGDVAGDDFKIASNDASKIQEYFLTLGNPSPAFTSTWSFWTAGETISDNPSGSLGYPTVTVPAVGTTVIQNFYGLVTGDFNRSFIPGASKSASESLTLTYGENIEIGTTEFELPLYAGMDMNVAAISLILNVPAGMLEVQGVYLGSNPDASVPYSLAGDELRISWQSLTAISLQKGEAMLTLKLSLLAPADEAGIRLSLADDPLNELADDSFNVIDPALLVVDVVYTTLFTGTSEFGTANKLMFAASPNPFEQNTNLVYSLPADGQISLEVYDMLGNKVKTLVSENQQAGEHQLAFNANMLKPGIYIAILRLQNAETILTQTIKLVSR